ncbi:MAG: alpha/beta fold hydrolase [Microthrixaceae bacterium]
MSAFVLVHGICHGAWCWDATAEELRRRGHDVIAVDLPLTGLDADAGVVQQALDQVDGPAVLVGHSYGGLVISTAAGRDDVEHLVYVAAVMLDEGDVFATRMAEFPDAPIAELVELTEDGYLIVRPEAAVACFYNECEASEAREAAERMRPTAFACLGAATAAEPWRTIPSTYVLCERDLAIHPDLQHWMCTRAGTVVAFDTDHSPFMSTPDPFVDVLDDVASGPSAGRGG